MKKLSIFVSLSTSTNDFIVALAESAQASAEKLGVEAHITYAGNDPLAQGQQLFDAIQSQSARPDAILFHPFGSTALPHVARAAVAAGIGVGVLNWRADYIAELRHGSNVPVFACGSDQREIGRIQAHQAATLLPEGGTVLQIQGPSVSHAAQERALGMNERKLVHIQSKIIKANAWTEEAGYKAVSSWLRLSTSQVQHIDLIAAQNDGIAVGARKAFGEILNEIDHNRWMKLPFTGANGLPKTGQAWVRGGLLAATVIDPPSAGLALETMVNAIRGGQQAPECIFTQPRSFPSIEELKNRAK